MASLTVPTHYNFQLLYRGGLERAVYICDPSVDGKVDDSNPALGAQGVKVPCTTCGCNIKSCPGHSGVIKTYPTLVPIIGRAAADWLGIVCSRCGRIALSTMELATIRRQTGASKGIDMAKVRTSLQSKGADSLCPHCREPLRVFRPVAFWTGKKYDYTTPALFYIGPPGKKGSGMEGVRGYHELPIVDNVYVWDIMKMATEEDCTLMGWNYALYHPRYFMSDHTPIAPPNARPRTSGGLKFAAGKAKKLHTAIGLRQRNIATALGGRTLPQAQKDLLDNPRAFNELVEEVFLLYYTLCALHTRLPEQLSVKVEGESKSSFSKGKALSYVESLGKKNGFLRRNVLRIKHNVHMRTTLTGFLGGIGTASCPKDFAMKVCMPATVTPDNIELMRSLVRNGPNNYPGAISYKRNGMPYNLVGKDLTLVAGSIIPGDIISRHLLTGDCVIHQRYPSLREESVNIVMVVVSDSRLIMIPVSTMAKMMADCDGDETQFWVPSSFGVAAEGSILSSLLRQLLQPKDAYPAIGIGGDAGTDAQAGIDLLNGINSFSERDVLILFEHLFTDADPPSDKKEYTFNDLINVILPENFCYGADACGDASTKGLVIDHGIITRGRVTSQGFVYKPGKGHLLKALAHNIDPYSAIKVLEDITRLAYKAVEYYGWTIADDARPTGPSHAKIKALVAERVRLIDECVNQFHRGELQVPIGQDPQEFFESRVTITLANAHSPEIAKEVAGLFKGTTFERHGYHNDFRSRINSAIVSRGQITDQGHRLRPRLCEQTRHTVWYPRSDDGAKAGGFIESSYLEKESPPEHFYESIPSREQVFDKGVSLQEQGYFNRKASTTFGPIHIGYLGEIRGHNNAIIDFSYGHCNTDSHYCVDTLIDGHIVSEKEFKGRYSHPPEAEVLRRIRDEWREAITMYAHVTSNDDFTPTQTTFHSPVDIEALLMLHRPSKPSKVSIEECWKLLVEVEELLTMCHIGRRAGSFMQQVVSDRVKAFLRLFRFKCHTGRFIEEGWSIPSMKLFLMDVLRKYAHTLAAAGDMVGLKAALNIIAPQTQAQLHATRGGKEMKGTISNLRRPHGTRLYREITEGLSPEAPLCSFMLKGSSREDPSAALDMAKEISSVFLKDVLIESHLFSVSSDVEADGCHLDLIQKYIKALPPTLRKAYDSRSKSWFQASVHLDNFRLLLNKVDVTRIALRIQEQFNTAVDFVIPVHLNKDGLALNIIFNQGFSLETLTARYHAIIDTAVIHGHPSFSNGTVIEYDGTPSIHADGSLRSMKTYRIVMNGVDLKYLHGHPDIDGTSIFTNNIKATVAYYGIEEARYRAIEEMTSESSQIEDLASIHNRHFAICVGYITYRGVLTFIPRSGMKDNPDVDDLDRISFEMAGAFLGDALTRSHWRSVNSSTACALYGVTPLFGATISTIELETSAVFPSDDNQKSDSIMDKLNAPAKSKAVGKKDSGTKIKSTPIDKAIPK